MAIKKNPDGTVTMDADAAATLVNAAKPPAKADNYYTDADIPEDTRRMSDDDLDLFLAKMERQRQDWNDT